MLRSLAGEHVSQELFVRAAHLREGRWHSITASPIRDARGALLGAITVSRDVTERRRNELQLARQADELRSLALRDALTGLYNRRGFLVLGEQQIRQAARSGRGMALLYADLDDLKPINDKRGHEEGDRALQQAANILGGGLRSADIVARLGGDEFAALLPEGSAQAAQTARTRLLSDLAVLNRTPGRLYPLSMSIGYVVYDPDQHRTLEDLLTAGDAAMYVEKRAAKAARAGGATAGPAR
jgi:diguanylate cyclase (GGDEF)-like protein